MRRLMLLRHAKSDWSRPDLADRERMLTRRGRDAAPRVGAYLNAENLAPDLVICSDARRTRDTWALLAPSLTASPPVRYEPRVYEAMPATLLSLVREADDAARSVMLLGHNPGLQELAVRLVDDRADSQRIAAKFPTAALAVIDFDVERWADVAPGTGRLERFITPADLA